MFTALLIACFVNSNRSCRKSLGSALSKRFSHLDSSAQENLSASLRLRKPYTMAREAQTI